MPSWSEELVSRPWSKQHNVTLLPPEAYDRAANRGGSNKIRRHEPLSLASGSRRKAGTSGYYDEVDHDHKDHVYSEGEQNGGGGFGKLLRQLSGGMAGNGHAYEGPVDWDKAFKDKGKVVSIRDVKTSTKDYKALHPNHHAFARYVLPVASNVFSLQEWEGKEHDPGEEQDQPMDVDAQDDSEGDDKPEMLAQEGRFYEHLVQEMDLQRSFQNNDGKPSGDLKALDATALQQLESALSVEDQTTPDSWIPRSSRLIRLAGTHPVNAEVETAELYEAGMITPTKLHYVRSHGAVPQLSWETHRLTVFSDPPELISDPKNWSMDEIVSGAFKIVELPITFACDGNRRKEMSMTKQSSGISFSASGVSTCLWRGVFVRDILLASGLQDQPDSERWFLHFEGADECSEGRYATSIPLIHAMDVTNDVMLAFGMNGRVLHPDHGYPLRVVIPGYVGGRQVKWVHKLWITKEPNSSYYHIWDNRTLPSFIESRDHPLAGIFYHNEGTACNEQCLQSVICKPAHNESVPLAFEDDDNEQMYTVEGFAYNGGGTAINRVELSLDGGKTWKYCFKRYVDKPLRHGEKHWAWIFWTCDVPLLDLANAELIAVRAVDARMQAQPEYAAWNMLGMMNNSWYRIKPAIVRDSKNRTVVKFKHPVTNKKENDGWMKPTEVKDASSDERSDKKRVLSLEEISKHDSKEDAWIIIDNKVYDVTPVLSWHPGGDAAILAYAGKASVDATIQYKGIHDNYANSKRDECYIGDLSDDAVKEMEEDAKRAAEAMAKIKRDRKDDTLQPDSFTRATLIKKKEVSKDTRTYQFALPKKENGEIGVFRLPIGKHILLSIHFADQAVFRAYTPIRPVLPHEEDGTFTLCIKTYFPTKEGPFPPGGLISNYLDCMKEGEEIDVRGPVGEIEYKGRGHFEIEGDGYHFDKINLVAGGTGLTPHWQLIHAILSDPEDETCISMIDSNKTFEDILLYDELKRYADQYSERFKLYHALSKAPSKKWPYEEGPLTQELMEKQFYPPEPGTATLLCGPPGLIEHAVMPGLGSMGFVKGDNIFGF